MKKRDNVELEILMNILTKVMSLLDAFGVPGHVYDVLCFF